MTKFIMFLVGCMTLITITAIMCCGCSTPQLYITKTVLPPISANYLLQCPMQSLLIDGTQKDVIRVLIEDDANYRVCVANLQAWQQWYLENQKLMEKTK